MGVLDSIKRLFGSAKEATERAEPYVEKAKEALEEAAEKAEPYVEKARETLGMGDAEEVTATEAPAEAAESGEQIAPADEEGAQGSEEPGAG